MLVIGKTIKIFSCCIAPHFCLFYQNCCSKVHLSNIVFLSNLAIVRSLVLYSHLNYFEKLRVCFYNYCVDSFRLHLLSLVRQFSVTYCILTSFTFIINHLRAIWPKGYQCGSLRKSHQNGDFLKASNVKKLSSCRNAKKFSHCLLLRSRRSGDSSLGFCAGSL